MRGERGLVRVRRLDRVDEESSQDEQRQQADNGQYMDDVPLDTRQVSMVYCNMRLSLDCLSQEVQTAGMYR